MRKLLLPSPSLHYHSLIRTSRVISYHNASLDHSSKSFARRRSHLCSFSPSTPNCPSLLRHNLGKHMQTHSSQTISRRSIRSSTRRPSKVYAPRTIQRSIPKRILRCDKTTTRMYPMGIRIRRDRHSPIRRLVSHHRIFTA